MPEKSGGTAMTDNVTKQDLKDLSDDIKKHITLVVSPLQKDIEDVEIAVFGKSKRNGLVGDQNIMKAEQSKTLYKSSIIYGLLTFVSVIIVGTAIKLIFFG